MQLQTQLQQMQTIVAQNSAAIKLFKNQYATNDAVTAISNSVNEIIQDNNQIHADVATLSNAISKIDFLSKLNDIKIINPTQGDVLQYDATMGRWCNVQTVISTSGGSTGGATYLRDLHDVQISSLADGHCLVYNTSIGKWINDTVATGGSGTTDLSNYLTKTAADATYLKLTGGTITGQLTVKQLTTLEDNLVVNGGITFYK